MFERIFIPAFLMSWSSKKSFVVVFIDEIDEPDKDGLHFIAGNPHDEMQLIVMKRAMTRKINLLLYQQRIQPDLENHMFFLEDEFHVFQIAQQDSDQ